jgi:hypothetical protein
LPDTPLATGSYVVSFFAPEGADLNYAPQYYRDKSLPSEAEPVSVSVETVASGIDAALVEGGQITGKVTSHATGAALGEVSACAFSHSEAPFRCAITGFDGSYDITSLATAEYFVVFLPEAGEYGARYYDEASSLKEAKPVSVHAGATAPLIDAALWLLPQDLSPPEITGSPVEGQTLNVLHGSWSGEPSSYVDEWWQCNAEEEHCSPLALGETYTLSVSLVGHRVGVIETARNSAGEGYPAVSELTGVVEMAQTQQQSSTSGSQPVAVAPAPAVGVLGVTSSLANASQLKSLLISLLAPTGKNAKIGVLLKHGGFQSSFNAFAAGQITIAWYLVPKGAHLSRAKPTLIARGELSLASASAAKLAIKLTSKGRELLKHAHRIRLTAQGTITSPGASSIGASRSFSLER